MELGETASAEAVLLTLRSPHALQG